MVTGSGRGKQCFFWNTEHYWHVNNIHFEKNTEMKYILWALKTVVSLLKIVIQINMVHCRFCQKFYKHSWNFKQLLLTQRTGLPSTECTVVRSLFPHFVFTTLHLICMLYLFGSSSSKISRFNFWNHAMKFLMFRTLYPKNVFVKSTWIMCI